MIDMGTRRSILRARAPGVRPRRLWIVWGLLALLGGAWLGAGLGCGGVRIGQDAEEAASEPGPAASEPPVHEQDPPPPTTPIITVDLEARADAGASPEGGARVEAGQE